MVVSELSALSSRAMCRPSYQLIKRSANFFIFFNKALFGSINLFSINFIVVLVYLSSSLMFFELVSTAPINTNSGKTDWFHNITDESNPTGQPRRVTVVQPILLSPLFLNHKVISPPTLQFSLFVFAEVLNFTIVREFEWTGVGSRKSRPEDHWSILQKGHNCSYYTGGIDGDSESVASFSLCGGLMGIFHFNNREFLLEPVSEIVEDYSGTDAVLVSRPHYLYYDELNNTKNKSVPFQCLTKEADSRASEHPHNQPNHLLRSKRSTNESPSRNQFPAVTLEMSHDNIIEVLVVVTSNIKNRFKDKLQQYIFTNMATASAMLRRSSLKASLKISIVDIVSLDKEFERKNNLDNWNKNQNEGVLKAFCEWTNKLRNVYYTWDTALLLNIGYFSTQALGVAQLRSMCDEQNNCFGVMDRGLGTGFIIAHELGHQLGALHDFTDNKSTCTSQNPEDNKNAIHDTIMSTSLSYHLYPWRWSQCSQKKINYFLASEHSDCLRRHNQVSILYSAEQVLHHHNRSLPGETRSLDRQCALALNSPAHYCGHNMMSCRQLFCKAKYGIFCMAVHTTWAEGTVCSEHSDKWCIQGHCVPRSSRPRPVNGRWGRWGRWSACSRTCGGGIQFTSRNCNNSEPKHGGLYCHGSQMLMRSCSVQACDKKINLRKEGCQKLSKSLGIELEHYIPSRSDAASACKLICQNKEGEVVKHNVSLVDGAPCNSHKHAVCVHGKCWPTGCDRIINSKKQYDRCDVCDGNGSSCRRIDGMFNRATSQPVPEIFIALSVPKGASSLLVRKISSRNSEFSKDCYDDYMMMVVRGRRAQVRRSEGTEHFGGVELYYSGTRQREEVIRITGRLMHSIQIAVHKENAKTLLPAPSISFEFYMLKEARSEESPAVTKDQFVWDFHTQMWTGCNDMCIGIENQVARCVRLSDKSPANTASCHGTTPSKPRSRSCWQNCGFRWAEISHLEGGGGGGRRGSTNRRNSECSVRCGRGVFQEHQFVCVAKNSSREGGAVVRQVNATRCVAVGLPRPQVHLKKCEGSCLPTRWQYTAWSDCSNSCGEGEKYRRVRCIDQSGVPWPNSECIKRNLKITVTPCLGVSGCTDKVEWTVGGWSPCLGICDEGVQYRSVGCRLVTGEHANPKLCNATSPMPAENKVCPLGSCYYWSYTGVTQCSVSCGSGRRSRYSRCLYTNPHTGEDDVRSEEECQNTAGEPIESHYESCHLKACPGFSWSTQRWSQCQGNCLYGFRIRNVTCLQIVHGSNKKQQVSNEFCDSTTKPKTRKRCLLSSLCGVWWTGYWSKCSRTCGLGIRRRPVECRSISNSTVVPDSLCPLERPPQEVDCEGPPCPYDLYWKAFFISDCISEECRLGVRYRIPICSSSKEGPVPWDSCKHLGTLSEKTACIPEKCSEVLWFAEDWSTCIPGIKNSGGFSYRNVLCVDQFGDINNDAKCSHLHKPISKKKCSHHCRGLDCVPKSCRDVQLNYDAYFDGDYAVEIDNQYISIYCSEMKTLEPKEYIDLKIMNYAKSSNLIFPEGQQRNWCKSIITEETCPDCKKDVQLKSTSYFYRIRVAVNLGCLKGSVTFCIVVEDYTFSDTLGESKVPYGTAKDCTHSETCPQGEFLIDLTGTGFIVSNKTKWQNFDPLGASKISWRMGSKAVYGRCGGSCSGCFPVNGLQLAIDPTVW